MSNRSRQGSLTPEKMGAEPKIEIFVSCVTKELGSYRAEVAVALREQGHFVRVQEEFTAGPGTLLDKLDAYIKTCDAVICLIGNRYGAAPPDTVTVVKGGEAYSYTQWEYLFARKYRKPIFVFHVARDGTTEPDPEHVSNPESVELIELQSKFFQNVIVDEGIDRNPFSDHGELVRKVLVTDIRGACRRHTGQQLPPFNPNSPYVGLRRFEEINKAYFYGRSLLVEEVLGRIESRRFLLFTGHSGSGKSSVIRAGVIPQWRLRQEANNRVLVITPNTNPFESLRAALIGQGVDPGDLPDPSETSQTIFEELYQKIGEGEQWLIIIDQFEEIFSRIPGDSEVRDAFVASLVSVGVPKSRLPIRIVLVMRDDFFTNLSAYRALHRITDENLKRMVAMDHEELRQVIELPANDHGVRFEEGLTERIIKAVVDSSGMLPLLQYTLQALWKQELESAGGAQFHMLSLQSYKDIGEVSGALQERVSYYYERKKVEERKAVRNILLCLVDIDESDSSAISKSASRSELEQIGSKTILDQLLDEEKLLISALGKENEPIVELAHEALIDGWETFEEWIKEYREAIVVRNRLRADARRWKSLRGESARDELWQGSRLERVCEFDRDGEFERIGGLSDLDRKFIKASNEERSAKTTRLKRALGFVTLISLLAVAATIFAIHQRNDANVKREQAQVEAGKGWMLQAHNSEAKGNGIEATFMAARAIGFDGLGKKNSASKYDDEFAQLFEKGSVSYLRALRKAATGQLPYLWSSPLSSQFVPESRYFRKGGQR